MAPTLKSTGFKVKLLKNATRREMEKAIRIFGGELRGGWVGLFYFAGDDISKQDEGKWCEFLAKKGFKKIDGLPNRGAKEYNNWITFSYHPLVLRMMTALGMSFYP